MIRIKNDNDSNGINWSEKLSTNELKAAEEIKKHLLSNQKINWERADKETYLSVESSKDPYELAIALESKTEVITDGIKTEGKSYPLGNGQMKSISIKGYNYIILKQHLPNPKGKGHADSWYQSIICKTYPLKLYCQQLVNARG